VSFTQLKGFDSLGQYSYDEILTQNLIMFFDWGFINKGGYVNVNIPSSGAYGGDFSRLRPVQDPRYSNGQVWESIRANWLWESGLEYESPINISGVFVNSTFVPQSGGTFYIDYPNGRIIFNSAISQNSTVKVEHSRKWISVIPSQNVPWLKQVEMRSHRVDDSNFLIGSGDFALLRDNKLQLPVVAIETAGATYQGYMIGGSQYCYTRVKFYVIGEDKSTVDRLTHIISSQNDKSIFLFDSNSLATNNRFPLDYRGSRASGCLSYPQLVEYSGHGGYRLTDGLLGGKISFSDAQSQPVQELTTNIYQRVVTITTEGILTKI